MNERGATLPPGGWAELCCAGIGGPAPAPRNCLRERPDPLLWSGLPERVFSDTLTGTGTSHNLISRASSKRSTQAQNDVFWAAGLAWLIDTGIRDLRELAEKGGESCAQMDVTFGLADGVVERVGYLASALIIRRVNFCVQSVL